MLNREFLLFLKAEFSNLVANHGYGNCEEIRNFSSVYATIMLARQKTETWGVNTK